MVNSSRYKHCTIRLTISIFFMLLMITWAPKGGLSIQAVLRVPQDYPTIQAAIDAAPEGAIILINNFPLTGIYYEEVIVIRKSVTLRAEAFTAFIRGPDLDPFTAMALGFSAVINIVSDVPIQVALEDLNISQGEMKDVMWVYGPARVILKKTHISYYYGGSGLVVENSAHVTLQDSIVSGFVGDGLQVRNASVELINSQVTGTKENVGLSVAGTSRVSLQKSTVSGHGGGILVAGPAQVTLQDSMVVGNEEGMEITYDIISEQPAVVTIERSQISSNRYAGIHNRGSVVELSDSFVIGNGVDPKCHQLPLAIPCSGSGIILNKKASLGLRSTEIRNNATWGVAAYLPQCGAPSYVPPFSVEVIFEDDKNIIENNNRSGKLNSMGNPGNHPFKTLPDGQVCLP